MERIYGVQWFRIGALVEEVTVLSKEVEAELTEEVTSELTSWGGEGESRETHPGQETKSSSHSRGHVLQWKV